MATLKKVQEAQAVMSAEFSFTYADVMADINGTTRDFGSLAGGSSALTVYNFNIIDLPRNSIVVGGAISRTTAFDTGGYDITLGHTDPGADDGVDAENIYAAADVKAAGVTALTTTGYVNVNGLPIRLSISTDDECTAGVCHIRVDYIVRGKSDEVTG